MVHLDKNSRLENHSQIVSTENNESNSVLHPPRARLSFLEPSNDDNGLFPVCYQSLGQFYTTNDSKSLSRYQSDWFFLHS